MPDGDRTLDSEMVNVIAATARAAVDDSSRLQPAKRAVAAISGALDGAQTTVFLCNQWTHALYCVAGGIGDGGPSEQGVDRESQVAFLGLAMDGREPHVLAVRPHDGALRPWWDAGFAWAVAIPFRSAGQSFGGMVTRGRSPYEPDGAALGFVSSIASITGMGLAMDAHPFARDSTLTLDHVVRAQEDERARISRDLHDEVNQVLPAILVSLKLLLSKIDEPGAQDDVEAIRDQVRGVFDDLRRAAHGLRPPELDDLGLAGAVESLCSTFSAEHNIDASAFHVDANCPCRSDAIDVTLYRIVQEALANVARHSDASQVSVVITCRDGLVAAQIEDNGSGARPQEDTPGVGLTGMRERAELLGGRVRVESSPGAGTTVYAEIPADYVVTGRSDELADPPPDRA